MSSIADLVKNRAKQLDIQIRQAKPIDDLGDVKWLQLKAYLENQKIDPQAELTSRLDKHPETVKVYEYKQNSLVSIEYPELSKRFRIILEIAESRKDGSISARYIALRQDPYICYVRHIQGKDWLV